MGWIKLNHVLLTHPAVWQAGGRAVGCYLIGLLKSNEARRPGLVTRADLIDTLPSANEFDQVASRLIESGLWVVTEEGFSCPQQVGRSKVEIWKKGRLGGVRVPVPQWMRRAVFERDGWKCRHCGSGVRLEADHIFPYSKGGATTLENLQTLCKTCNIRKGARI